MKRELREFYLKVIVRFELLDTPGDEITPRSDEVRKYFENHSIGHGNLLLTTADRRRLTAAGAT
jgi:hypothetical protein